MGSGSSAPERISDDLRYAALSEDVCSSEQNKDEELDSNWYYPCGVQFYAEEAAGFQDSWDLSCEIRVLDAADRSRFEIRWGSAIHGGAIGLSQDGNRRFTDFAVWNLEGDSSSVTQNYSLGKDVRMKVETTGHMQMEKAFQWSENEDVRLIVKKEKGRVFANMERWKISCWYEYQGRKENIGTLEQLGHPVGCKTFWSTIKLDGHSDKIRRAEYFDPKLNGKIIEDALFRKGHDSFRTDPLESTTGGKIGSKGVILWSGGRIPRERGMADKTNFQLPSDY